MNELLSDTPRVLWALFGIIGTLIGVIGAIALYVFKGHVKRIDFIEENFVSKTDLDRRFEEMYSRQDQRHDDNLGQFEDLKEMSRETRAAIKEMFLKLIK